MKAYRESEFPELRRPSRKIIINPELDEVKHWIWRVFSESPPFLTIDCETTGGMIDTLGFAIDKSDALVIPFGPHRVKRGNNYYLIYPQRNGKQVTSYWSLEEEIEVWTEIYRLMICSIPKLFQNGLYDIQYLMKVIGLPNNCLHDTMLAWHSLFPEMPKNLGFLGSVLTNDIAWKRFRSARSDTEKKDD